MPTVKNQSDDNGAVTLKIPKWLMLLLLTPVIGTGWTVLKPQVSEAPIAKLEETIAPAIKQIAINTNTLAVNKERLERIEDNLDRLILSQTDLSASFRSYVEAMAHRLNQTDARINRIEDRLERKPS